MSKLDNGSSGPPVQNLPGSFWPHHPGPLTDLILIYLTERDYLVVLVLLL